MAAGMSESTLLSSVNLSQCKLCPEAVADLFGGSFSDDGQLEYLNLSGVQLTHSMGVIGSFLSHRSSLAELNLDSTSLGNESINLLANALNQIRVDELYLDDNRLGNNGLAIILGSGNSKHLQKLWLGDNRIGDPGYSSIAKFLENKLTLMNTLCLKGNNTLGRTARAEMICALANNSRVEYISLPHQAASTSKSAKQFRSLVCNTVNFSALCHSNHRLWSFGADPTRALNDLSPSLRRCLDINSRIVPINAKIRSKLQQFYFQGEFDVLSPFINMDAKLMPSILELATMSEELCGGRRIGRFDKSTPVLAQNGHLGGIYRLVRNYWNLQELFSFTSPYVKIQELESEIQLTLEDNANTRMENASPKERIAQLMAENGKLRSKTAD